MSGASKVSPQDAAYVRFVDLLGSGDFRDGRVRAGLQHFPPAERPGDRLDHGVVDVPMTVAGR
jgi:hypothetical protein